MLGSEIRAINGMIEIKPNVCSTPFIIEMSTRADNITLSDGSSRVINFDTLESKLKIPVFNKI